MSRITKKTVAAIAAVVLAFALAFATVMTYVGPATANAAAPETAVDVLTAVDTGVTDHVKYGGTFTVSAPASDVTLRVVTPGGVETEYSAQTDIKADELGVYRVYYDYKDGENVVGSYYYNVECYNDVEYKLIVDGYGAGAGSFENNEYTYNSGIPSYRELNGDDVVLPDATLYYYDEEDEEWFPVSEEDGSKVYCRIVDPGAAEQADSVEIGTTAWDSAKTVKPDTLGTYFFTYYAQLAGGKNVISEEYTMQVQQKFTDDQAPTLSVSGISSSESVGTEVTLPAATVSDNYDKRVQVVITVEHAYAGGSTIPVRAAVIDPDTGYAVRDDEGKTLFYKADADGDYAIENGERATTTNPSEAVAVTFDNDNFMSFYPTESGIYTVTYRAVDLSGNATAAHSYTVNVSDTTAPVYDEFETSVIPSQWGLNSVERKATTDDGTTDNVSLDNRNIAFPIPELIDNNDGDADLTVSFTMNDPNSNTLLSFTNIYATEYDQSRTTSALSNYDDGARYAFFRYWVSGKYTVGDDFKLTGEGVGDNVYSLIKYDPDTGVYEGNFDFSEGTAKTGSYSVTYTARDSVGNSRSQSFSINLQSSLIDAGDPTVDFDAPDYLAFTPVETETTINDVLVTDSQDTRLNAKYYLVINPAEDLGDDPTFDEVIADRTEGTDYVELDYAAGSNTLTLVNEGNGNELTVTNADGEEVTLTVTAANVYVIAKATDDVGNTREMVSDAIPVLDGTKFESQTIGLEFGGASGATLDLNGTPGEELLVGSALITYGGEEYRDYTGFELYVQRVLNAEGVAVDEAPLGSVSFETYSYADTVADTYMIHVDNIRFTPSTTGTYMIVLRAFNVMGKSYVKMAFADIAASTDNSGNKPTTSASINLPDTLEIGQTYKLNDSYTVDPSDFAGSYADSTYGIVRSISGGRLAVMGNEVTVYSTGYYEFTDNVFMHNASADKANGMNSVIDYKYTNAVGEPVTGNYAGVTAGSENYTFDGLNGAKQMATKIVNSSDTASTVFELQGAMPVYSELDKTVKLPNMSAYTANGAATDIDIKVTDADGEEARVYRAGDTDLPDGLNLVGNEAAFIPDVDGKYTVVYSATFANGNDSVEYTISAGDIIAPDVIVNLGVINSSEVKLDDGVTSVNAKVGDTFDFSAIKVNESTTGFTFNKELKDPSGETVGTVTSAALGNNGTSYTLSTAGRYEVTYSVTDAAGNRNDVKYTIVVSGSTATSPSSGAVTTLAVVLIIVGVVLIAGVVIYLVRFRRRKPAKK